MPLPLISLRVLTTALFLASIVPTALITVSTMTALAQTTQNS